MRCLTLALLLVFPTQEPVDPKPPFRRSMTLVNRSDAPLPAGVQVQITTVMMFRIADGSDASDVQVFHGGKRIASWTRGAEIWFRTASSIPGRGRDAGYDVRYGGGKAVARPREVFEFFDDFSRPLDPRRWDWDPDLGFRETPEGLEIHRIPGARNEHAPASLIPKFTLPAGFVVEAEMRWAIDAAVPASFALRVDLTPEEKPTPESIARAAELVKKLADEDIEARDGAIRELLKAGLAAVPALEAAARSSDSELRQRAAQVLSRILELEPPAAIRSGLTTSASVEGMMDRIDLLGRSRTTLRRSHPRNGGDTLAISRAEDGETALLWTRRRPVKVAGTAARVRLDFWSATTASAVKIHLRRVAVRRYVELMPAAEIGPEEVLR